MDGRWPLSANGVGALLMYQTTPAAATTPMTRPRNRPISVPPFDFFRLLDERLFRAQIVTAPAVAPLKKEAKDGVAE